LGQQWDPFATAGRSAFFELLLRNGPLTCALRFRRYGESKKCA
jgi:hypothetical protein